MRVCAENPTQGEYSLCGDAFDIADDDDEAEPFRMAKIRDRVNCEQCLRVIRTIKVGYTNAGRRRS